MYIHLPMYLNAATQIYTVHRFFSFDSIHGPDQITKLCNFAEERQISLKRGWVNTKRLLWWPIWEALRVTMCFDSMRISRFNIVLVNPLILWLQRCTIHNVLCFAMISLQSEADECITMKWFPVFLDWLINK